jgi:circadian clock protein KaiC
VINITLSLICLKDLGGKMYNKIKTGVSGLDEMLFGGIYEKSITSINGAAGTGKTTLGLQFIVEGIKSGEPGIVILFEQFPEQIYRDGTNYGWDFKKSEKEGLLKIVFTSPEIFEKELENENGLLDQLTLKEGYKRILVDPVTYFRYLNSSDSSLRKAYNKLANGIKRCSLTGFLTTETAHFFGESGEIDEELAFVVDNIILLRYVEIESKILNAITALKTRGSNRIREIKEYMVTDKGFVVTDTFKNREGILTGTPRKTWTDSVAKDFEL